MLLRKTDALKTLIFKFKSFSTQVTFWGAPTYAGIAEF